MLGRPITTIELIQLNKFFSYGRGYKDLIRDFKKCFNVDLPKKTAKEFMQSRSWSDVLYYLTGERIAPDDSVIPETESKHFELLERMLEVNEQDNIERDKDLSVFESNEYYIPESVKFFNIPLYGEIITYKFKEPYLKCFLFTVGSNQRRKLDKIEDVPISNELPEFLLRIIRKINSSYIVVDDTDKYIDTPNWNSMIMKTDAEMNHLTNILQCDLFLKYGIVAKED